MHPDEIKRIRQLGAKTFLARDRHQEDRMRDAPNQIEALIGIVHDLSLDIAQIERRLLLLETKDV